VDGTDTTVEVVGDAEVDVTTGSSSDEQETARSARQSPAMTGLMAGSVVRRDGV
jgi:hypothetical protein